MDLYQVDFYIVQVFSKKKFIFSHLYDVQLFFREDQFRGHLEEYLNRARSLAMGRDHMVEVCVLCVQCMEVRFSNILSTFTVHAAVLIFLSEKNLLVAFISITNRKT